MSTSAGFLARHLEQMPDERIVIERANVAKVRERHDLVPSTDNRKGTRNLRTLRVDHCPQARLAVLHIHVKNLRKLRHLEHEPVDDLERVLPDRVHACTTLKYPPQCRQRPWLNVLAIAPAGLSVLWQSIQIKSGFERCFKTRFSSAY